MKKNLLQPNALLTLLLGIFLMLITARSFARQSTPISGQVKDASSGEPLLGVSVFLKGGTTQSKTDDKGNFVISAERGQTLIFRYVGYDEVQQAIVNSTMQVVMASNLQQLEEVAVVGYNVVKRENLTGAVASIGSKQIEQLPVQNPLQAMQGRIAGVDVTANARPGEMGSIRVRGNRSLLATNNPLYVVDGIPLSAGGIDAINPHDIETIDVLKDASATAVYGSRAANGVIMITTKRGKQGTAQINYNVINTFERINDLNTVFNAGEYAEYRRNAFRSVSTTNATTGYTTPYPNPVQDKRILGVDPYAWESIAKGYTWVDKDNLIAQMRPTTAEEKAKWGVDEVPMYDASQVPTTDWTDYVTQTGFTTDHTLGVSMGSDKMTANFTGGYLNQKGTNKGQDYKRYSGRVGLELRPTNWFTLGASINGTWSVQNYGYTGSGSRAANAIYGAAQGMLPYAVPYDNQGNYIYLPGGDINIVNPILEHEYVINERTALRALGSFYAELKLFDGLKYRMNYGPDFRNFRNGQFQDARSILRGGGASTSTNYARLNKTQNIAWTWDNLLYYNKTFAEKHNLDITLLHSMTSNRSESSDMTAIDLPYNSQLWYNLSSTARGELQGWGSGYSKNTLMSYMARVNYTFADKYILTASNRWDGASVLAPGNKWQSFPAAALAWRMEQESFIENSSWLNQLKLRVGVGTTGNSAIDPYTTMGGLIEMPIVFGNQVEMGYIPSDPKAANPGTMANRDLKWERTTQWNAAVDFGLFKNRLNGSLDFYMSKTSDLLMNRPIPTVNGFTTMYYNVGKTKNRGVELTLSSMNIDRPNFKWLTDFNIATNKDEIVELLDGESDLPASSFFIGQPLFVYYDYEKIGIWQTADAAEMAKFNENGATYKAGDIRVADLNGDYIIDNNNDRKVLGSRFPRWTAGITNTLNYKNWELSFFFYARWGFLIEGGAVDMQGRYASRKVDYWTPENPTNAYPRADYGNGGQPIHYSSMNYQNGSFIKLRNVSLGYNFAPNVLKTLHMSNLKLYAQMINPYIYVRNGFIDPDINSSISSRSFVLGLNVTF
ncbi:TonB-dependent receptor [Olivibacter sp. LS-1]|uniref:SusC/RagA family TonB-linked outer membrane protein n=1 Tax=Olivibacter sp. LS-1 TaxID=2592345 RepID=UPI0011EAF74C|nr:TonB-dependent receptor [Olivibacter sp. LS-1]QEL04135.1 TonB-dependent receptor [Olivibacter sp. LS-1]